MSTSAGDSKQDGLDDLFARVNQLLGGSGRSADEQQENADLLRSQTSAPDEVFMPRQPQTLKEAGISASLVERLVLKYLFQVGMSVSRQIAQQVKLSIKIIEPILKQLRHDKFIDLTGTTHSGDSEWGITEMGRDRGKRYSQECTYFGAAPVSLDDYICSVGAQTIAGQVVTADELRKAFDGLIINQEMLNKLGPAVNSGRGMFLYGQPGNGKTSIAERVTDAFGSSIWMPRAIYIEGEIVRVFDPGIHE